MYSRLALKTYMYLITRQYLILRFLEGCFNEGLWKNKYFPFQRKIKIEYIFSPLRCPYNVFDISPSFRPDSRNWFIFTIDLESRLPAVNIRGFNLFFWSVSLSAPCVYHWRCPDYDYKCSLFILSYFSKLGDFFSDNIQPLSHTI